MNTLHNSIINQLKKGNLPETNICQSPIEIDVPRILNEQDFVMLNVLRRHLSRQIINKFKREKDTYSGSPEEYEQELNFYKCMEETALKEIDGTLNSFKISPIENDGKQKFKFRILSQEVRNCLLSHEFINIYIRKILIQIACIPSMEFFSIPSLSFSQISSIQNKNDNSLMYNFIKYKPYFFTVKINKTSTRESDLYDQLDGLLTYDLEEDHIMLNLYHQKVQMINSINSLLSDFLKNPQKESLIFKADPFLLGFILTNVLNKYNLYENMDESGNVLKDINIALPNGTKEKREIVEKLRKIMRSFDSTSESMYIPILFYPFINIPNEDLKILYQEHVMSNPNKFLTSWTESRKKVQLKNEKNPNDPLVIEEFYSDLKRTTHPHDVQLINKFSIDPWLDYTDDDIQRIFSLSQEAFEPENNLSSSNLSHFSCSTDQDREDFVCHVCFKDYEFVSQDDSFSHRFLSCQICRMAIKLGNITSKWKNNLSIKNSWLQIQEEIKSEVIWDFVQPIIKNGSFFDPQKLEYYPLPDNNLAEFWLKIYQEQRVPIYHPDNFYQRNHNQIVKLNEVLNYNPKVYLETDFYTSMVGDDLSYDDELIHHIDPEYVDQYLKSILPSHKQNRKEHVDFGVRLKFFPATCSQIFDKDLESKSKQEEKLNIFVIPDIGKIITSPFHNQNSPDNRTDNNQDLLENVIHKRHLSYEKLMKIMVDFMQYFSYYFLENIDDQTFYQLISTYPHLLSSASSSSSEWDEISQQAMEINAFNFAQQLKKDLQSYSQSLSRRRPSDRTPNIYDFWMEINNQFIYDHKNLINRLNSPDNNKENDADHQKVYLPFSSIFCNALKCIEIKYLTENGIISPDQES